VCDAEQPGAETLGLAEAAQASENLQPDVLDQIVGQVMVLGEFQCVSVEGGSPAGDQVVEGWAFAQLAADDQ